MRLLNKQVFDTNIYFSSDFHLNHKNICRGTSTWEGLAGTRDFDTVEDMNDAIINSINSTVGEEDILFFMGDFNFGDKAQTAALRARILCKEIHFIFGNHDEHIRRDRELQSLFSTCQDFAEIKVRNTKGKDKLISLFHYPMKVWNKAHHGAFALTGHSHGSLPYTETELGLDVGWDVWGKPISYDTVVNTLKHRRFRPVDHHNEKTN